MNKETQILTRWVDPTIDDFKIALEEANKQIEEIYKEIERLNNIINELEKWLKENDKQLCLRKLKELKGDSSNE